MERRDFTARLLTLHPMMLGTAAGAVALLLAPAAAWPLGESEAAAGLRAAVERGASSAVSLLGRPDGFLGDPRVRIPLPGFLKDGARMLAMVGQQRQVDDLVTAMNRAAENAVPQARQLLVNAAKAMSVEDALHIVHGGATSVTDYFAVKTRVPLGEKFLPIVTASTQRVQLAEKYNAVAGKGRLLGLVKPEDANIEQYVTRKALDGLFLMIGEEEKKIRANPMGTGSDLLRKVFG